MNLSSRARLNLALSATILVLGTLWRVFPDLVARSLRIRDLKTKAEALRVAMGAPPPFTRGRLRWRWDRFLVNRLAPYLLALLQGAESKAMSQLSPAEVAGLRNALDKHYGTRRSGGSLTAAVDGGGTVTLRAMVLAGLPGDTCRAPTGVRIQNKRVVFSYDAHPDEELCN